MFNDAEYISSYTRSEAIEDGVLVDVTEIAKEVGFRYPVAVTSAVWDLLELDVDDVDQSINGRLMDLLFICYVYARKTASSVLHFPLTIIGKNYRFKSICHPGDNLEPVVTIMLPEED